MTWVLKYFKIWKYLSFFKEILLNKVKRTEKRLRNDLKKTEKEIGKN